VLAAAGALLLEAGGGLYLFACPGIGALAPEIECRAGLERGAE
jgi:hypothetical protein